MAICIATQCVCMSDRAQDASDQWNRWIGSVKYICWICSTCFQIWSRDIAFVAFVLLLASCTWFSLRPSCRRVLLACVRIDRMHCRQSSSVVEVRNLLVTRNTYWYLPISCDQFNSVRRPILAAHRFRLRCVYSIESNSFQYSPTMNNMMALFSSDTLIIVPAEKIFAPKNSLVLFRAVWQAQIFESKYKFHWFLYFNSLIYLFLL